MKTETKAFNISLLIHALILLTLTATGSFLNPPRPPMIIDFTMESPPVRTDLKSPEPKIRKHEKAAAKKQPISNEVIKEKPVEPIQEVKQTLQQESPANLPTKEEEKPDLQTQQVRQAAVSNAGADNAKNSALQAIPETKRSSEGSGTSPENERARYFRENFVHIRDIIQSRTTYPLIARRMGWEGKVIVSFIVSSDGRVRDLKIKEGSGFEVLDKSALTAVSDASPFPKPPVEAQLIIPIRYKLN